ncbi:hypothetical protein BMS3Abin03_00672 [bacterium BMS3Abin03]|nr:hypothetical protein BMS3Abin03_00672 [bacterium BMS3Abin03]
MAIPLRDKSNYLRGLLILARKDNCISDSDKAIIIKAAEWLGFSSDFCNEILKTLLENEFIESEPVKFMNHTVAQSFISDGLKLVCSNKLTGDVELLWLRKTAEINYISQDWCDMELAHCQCYIRSTIPTQLTLYSIM